MDELDNELFTCCVCKQEFSHIDGTWLPIGVEKSKFGKQVQNTVMWDLRAPEVVTSSEFTCYDCL